MCRDQYFILLPVIALAHFVGFPQETHCILTRVADFQQDENIYFRRDINRDSIALLKEIKAVAEKN